MLAAPNVTALGVVEFKAPALPNLKIPALMVTPPVNVLLPLIAHVPAPFLVIVPAPVLIMLETLPPLEPSSVRPKPAPVMVPALVSPIVPGHVIAGIDPERLRRLCARDIGRESHLAIVLIYSN